MGITSIFWNRKGAPDGDMFVPTGISTDTGYIHLPIWTTMFHTGAAYGTQPTRLPTSAGGSTGYPSFYYNITYDPTGGWIATYFVAAAETSMWHTMFRLRDDYVAGTNLTVTFNGLNVRRTGTGLPTTHSIDMMAIRDTNAEVGVGQGPWGYNATPFPGPGTFVWNKDICLTAVQDVFEVLEADFYIMSKTHSFVIDGDDADYPLTPGRWMFLTWTSVTESSDANEVRNKFCNFYVTYDKWAA